MWTIIIFIAIINYFAIDDPYNYEKKVIYYIPTTFIKN